MIKLLFASLPLFALVVPVDTTDIRSRLKKAFMGGTPEKKTETTPESALSRRSASEMHKQREKNRALATELTDIKTTQARKDEIIAGLQAERETLQSQVEEANGKIEELTPLAKAHRNYLNKERAKLIEALPPEKRGAAKKLAESLEIEDFREYIESFTGKSGGSQTAKKDDAGKSWETILSGTDNDAIGKAIEADTAGYNAYMDSLPK